MPDHANLAVALRRCGRKRARHSLTHGMELVIAGKNLRDPLPVSPKTMKSFTKSRNRRLSKTPLIRVSSSGMPFGAYRRLSLFARA